MRTKVNAFAFYRTIFPKRVKGDRAENVYFEVVYSEEMTRSEWLYGGIVIR
jgi:hypothetical protein